MSSGGAADITGTLPMADARYVKAKTCVWWDIENCQVPRLCDPYSIARNISKSLADMNYKGVVTISAYGDTTKINPTVQQALSSTGIALHHVPAGIKDASDKKILVDMLIWGYDNPPPANHLLISGDRDFSNALHQLSMRRYNILLAQPEKASQALVSAAKTVWLWTSLVVGDRPFEKLPNFHNTSTNSKSNTVTNSKSNTVTESDSIEYSSQPDDFNLKNNNNGNFNNSNKAKQISKTQSQPVISASSSNGNEDVSKQSIGSSDSSNLNQKNDLKHPNYMFVSTTADLGSNCITSSSNSNIITESNRILYSSQPDDINQKNNDNGNFDNNRKEEQILRTQSQPIISTSSSNGNEEGNKQSIGSSDSPDSDQRNDSTPEKVSQAFVSAAKTVWQWTSLVVGGRPVEKIPNLHDSVDNSISNNETQGCGISYPSQPDNLNQKNSDNGNLDNHNNAKQISKSQSQPIESASPSNGNEEGSKLSIGSSDSCNLDQKNDLRTPELCSNCIPKSQQLVDSGNSNAPCGPTFNYTPKIKPKMVKKIPSNTSISSTNGSGMQESTINEMTKVEKNSTLSRPSALVVPESANSYVSTDPISAQLGPDMASSNCMNELTQPRHAHYAKEGGDISNTFSSFSMKSSSQVLPESNSSNPPNNNANTMFTNNRNNGIVMKKNWRKNHKKQNVYSQSCHQSTDSSGSNYNSSSSSSSGPTIGPNDYQSVPPIMPDVSSATPIPDVSASSSNGNEEGDKRSIGSSDSSNINQKNDLNQPSHTCVLTAPDLDSSCITTNTNPTPCIPKSQKVVDFGKINAPSRHASNCKPKIKQKGGNISNTSSSYSTKPSSPALPESNPTNASKINATVKFAIKKNRKNNHKQQQNQCSPSSFRNLSGSNYNHSSSSSTVPTTRPNTYQAVHSTMPDVSLPTPRPDISKLNISDTANFLQGQMGFILEALNILKSEKISPTEANISDCIRYGNISVQNFNVKMALECAVEHQVVVMHKLGKFMPLYVGRNDTLWNCVNIMDSNADHGTENFDAVLKFLSSANGRSAILSSQCRYEAALIVRELCLKNIVLGEILQLLHIIIQFRKWIIPHASGWQPLAITVFINSDEGFKVTNQSVWRPALNWKAVSSNQNPAIAGQIMSVHQSLEVQLLQLSREASTSVDLCLEIQAR